MAKLAKWVSAVALTEEKEMKHTSAIEKEMVLIDI